MLKAIPCHWKKRLSTTLGEILTALIRPSPLVASLAQLEDFRMDPVKIYKFAVNFDYLGVGRNVRGQHFLRAARLVRTQLTEFAQTIGMALRDFAYYSLGQVCLLPERDQNEACFPAWVHSTIALHLGQWAAMSGISARSSGTWKLSALGLGRGKPSD